MFPATTNILKPNDSSYNSQWKSLLMVSTNSHRVWRFSILSGKSISMVLRFCLQKHLMILVKCERKPFFSARTLDLRSFQLQTFTQHQRRPAPPSDLSKTFHRNINTISIISQTFLNLLRLITAKKKNIISRKTAAILLRLVLCYHNI